MRRIRLSKRADRFLARLPPKQRRQVSVKLSELCQDPYPLDGKPLKGYPFWRADQGEYRIVYAATDDLLEVPLNGKRNDEVYRQL
jgi:mRNA-degrading endonuclease RelE of RelBE toxin-antitoxin system